jgi:hypothetical protein
MNNIRKIVLFSLSVLLLAGCATFKEAGVERGQIVFNKVGFRTYKENVIFYGNYFYGGNFIPAGTECTIKYISHKKIKFIANGDEYVLVDWRIGYGADNTRASFPKFFAESKETIGLNRINPDFRDYTSSGFVEVGMTKEEVLLSVGYPIYLGIKDPTKDDTRESILSHNDWYYLKSRRSKVLLRFKGEELAEIIGK